MTQLFPAILVGAPPNRGKSVLSYILSSQLQDRQVPVYLLRANPDGEGNWYYRTAPDLAGHLREKRPWDNDFEASLAGVITRRPLPYLVDAGGRPTASQRALFARCTHSIFLGQDEQELSQWRAIGEQYRLQPVAEIFSHLEGNDEILEEAPLLRLVLGRLERGRDRQEARSAPWQLLIGKVMRVIRYTEEELWDYHRNQAPRGTLPINVALWLVRHTGSPKSSWAPSFLPELLPELPANSPLAIYDAKPPWLLAAIAAHTRGRLYCFDARYGWIPLPLLEAGTEHTTWSVSERHSEESIFLSFTLQTTHLRSAPILSGPLPTPPSGSRVVMDGKLPNWLFAALARYYSRRGNRVAVVSPPRKSAVIVTGEAPGHLLPWDPDLVKQSRPIRE